MRRLGIVLIAAMLLAACSSVDCPLYKTVEARYKLAGVVDTLHDSLTVTSVNVRKGDSVLEGDTLIVIS